MPADSPTSSENATAPNGGRVDSLRAPLRDVMVAWVFGAVWLNITSGAALTRYAQLLGLPRFGYGVMAALPFAGALVQLPASYVFERYGHHKPVFIGAGVVQRLAWVGIALIPWLVPGAARWVALLALMLVSHAAGNVAAPVWYTWMAWLVPARVRGRYFSRRSQLGQLIGLGITLLTGVVLDRGASDDANALLRVIATALSVAAVFGAVDYLCFLGVPPPPHRPPAGAGWRRMLRQPLGDRNFLRFLGYSATMTFATGYIGQFVWLYMFDVVKMTNTQANTVLVLLPTAFMLLVVPVWGRVIDRIGRKPVLLLAGLMVVHGASAWILVTPERWWPGCVLAMVAVLGWPGVELAGFNVMLSMSESLSGRRYGTAYVAVLNLAVALAGIASGLFGGAVAEALKGWSGEVFGWPLTYHGVLFVISAAFRFASLLWLLRLDDHRAYGTREALHYMTTSLYSNLQEAIEVPGRILTRVGRAAYKLNPARRIFRP